MIQSSYYFCVACFFGSFLMPALAMGQDVGDCYYFIGGTGMCHNPLPPDVECGDGAVPAANKGKCDAGGLRTCFKIDMSA